MGLLYIFGRLRSHASDACGRRPSLDGTVIDWRWCPPTVMFSNVVQYRPDHALVISAVGRIRGRGSTRRSSGGSFLLYI